MSERSEVRHHERERQFLFGVVALQLSFITTKQLLQAARQWVNDKSQSIEQLLLRDEAISQQECDALSALVNGLVAKYNGDPAVSLASLSTLDASLQDQLGQLGDKDIDATISVSGSCSTDDRTATELGHVTQIGERFRIIRPHAEGGLGVVSLAKDVELNREVALKEIQQQFSHDIGSRERFLLEAEITGGLEHPGIVPVYGLGHYQDGRPFYAMRFIKGDSLKVAIERFHQSTSDSKWTIELRKLLRRFIDVCYAIEYAHNRGVLHRDLKPGNVMLGNYGETLVVDWGLAKTVDRPEVASAAEESILRPSSGSGSAPTQLGTAIGTPAYMSPEQAAGRLDQLGPASDVYSLGATLFNLLTGKSPITDTDIESVLSKVVAGEIPHARDILSDVPPALEGICRKAMRRQLEDRYLSPRLLAEDIERWLADEPVEAYREPVGKRMARWSRRHRTLVGSLAAAACVAVVSLVIGIVVLGAANQRERTARALAVANEQEAKRQQARSQRNFRLARSAVDDFLTQVSEDRRLQAQSLEILRRDLLTKARNYYEEFVKIEKGSIELEAERGYAYIRLATITHEIGSIREATELLTQAETILEAIIESEPENLEYLWELAIAYREHGRMLQELSRDDEAEVFHDQALILALRAAQLPGHEASLNYRSQLAWTFHDFGHFYSYCLRVDESQEMFEKALVERQKLIDTYPEIRQYRIDLAETYVSLGAVYYRSKNDAGQETVYREALRILDQENQSAVDQLEREIIRDDLALIRYNLGYLYLSQGKQDQAIAEVQTANEVWAELRKAHPDVTEYQRRVAAVNQMLGQLLIATDQLLMAKEHLVVATEAWEQLAQMNPDVIEYQVTLAQSYNTTAELNQKLGLHQESADSFTKTIELLKLLDPAFVERDVMSQVHRYEAHHGRAAAWDHLEEYELAANDWLQAIESEMGSHMGGPSSAFDLQMRYLRSLAKSGAFEEAASEVEQMIDSGELSNMDLFKAICILGVTCEMVQADSELPPEQREQLDSRLTAQAFSHLLALKEAGFFTDPLAKSSLERQPELSVFRDHPQWDELEPEDE